MNNLSGYGGSKKITISLINKLSHTYDIKLISLFRSEEPSYDIIENVSVVILYDKILNIYELSTYRKMFKNFKLIIIYELFVNLIYIIINYPKVRKKVLHVIKDVDSIVIPEIYGILYIPRRYLLSKNIVLHLHTSYRFIRKNIFIYTTLNIYKKYIDKLIVLTDADKDKFEDDSFKSVFRIYNPIEITDTFKERNTDGNIVFIGRLDIVKGVDYIIDIAKEVILKKNVCFEIYGDGPFKKKLKDNIQKNGFSKNIKLRGVTNDVYSVLKNASCLIVPSRHEGLPMIFLEALSCGVPIVAFNCFDGINEVIEDGKNGFVVEVGDIKEAARKILLLLDDGSLNNELGKNGFESVKKFEVENIIKEWKKIL